MVEKRQYAVAVSPLVATGSIGYTVSEIVILFQMKGNEMSWRVQYREKDQQYRLWSTISDTWLTGWETRQTIQRYIAEEMLFDYKKKVIEMYLKFPHHWPDADGGGIRYMQDKAGHQAYGAWLETLASASHETYEELVEQKYQEAVKALELEDQMR